MKKRPSPNIKRVVVKVGTSILTSSANRLDKPQIKNIVYQICSLLDRGIKVILVTSGAIGSGMGILKLNSRPKLLPKLQAAAAVGQSQLMKLYDSLFRLRGQMVAQILLTSEDLNDRKRYLNAKNTLLTLLDYRVIPIINENDTVSVDEIKFGDNDRLSALVTNLVEADLLIILSDVDGLYRQRPLEKIDVVEEITLEIDRLAAGASRTTSTGGMITKIQAAKIVTSSGVACIIANGRTKDVLTKVIDGEKMGTIFLPKGDKMVAKKRWIAFTSRLNGRIMVDEGAKDALTVKGKSLLPKGVVGLEGKFRVGDTVSVIDSKKKEFARGITNFASSELEKIKGLKTDQIEAVLGYKYYDEVVHRDNLVII